jgi:hypothetical protein
LILAAGRNFMDFMECFFMDRKIMLEIMRKLLMMSFGVDWDVGSSQ